MNKKTRQPIGMAAFIVIWIGQIVSVLASSMTHFALSILRGGLATIEDFLEMSGIALLVFTLLTHITIFLPAFRFSTGESEVVRKAGYQTDAHHLDDRHLDDRHLDDRHLVRPAESSKYGERSSVGHDRSN